MPLHNQDSLIFYTYTAAESLPDPTLAPQNAGRTHLLINAINPGISAPAVWSSVGATPFFEAGSPVATISVPAGTYKMVRCDGVHWVVF